MSRRISLQEYNPPCLKEWDYKKNNPLKPTEVTKASGKKVWWLCPHGHSYKAVVANRTVNNTGCPYCSGRKVLNELSLLAKFPDVAKEWDYKKNGNARPEHYRPKSSMTVWWKCPQGHSYCSVIAGRANGRGCPICRKSSPAASDKIHAAGLSLAVLCPEIAAEWDYEKNGETTPKEVRKGSKKIVWWLCQKGHSYDAKIVARTTQEWGCPYCAGKRVCIDNCLATKRADLAERWHPSLNGELTPHDVTSSSSKVVWWLCPNGHSFQKSIHHFNALKNSHNCPVCKLEKRKK